jgi:hypothetical protein
MMIELGKEEHSKEKRSEEMPKILRARAAQDKQEERQVRKLAVSRYGPADWITHARMVVRSWDGEQPISPELAAMVQAARQLLQTGKAPSQVAEMVFDAIRQEKFYILTDPTTKQGVQLRMEAILQERLPADMW